jgi:hypothetical protein
MSETEKLDNTSTSEVQVHTEQKKRTKRKMKSPGEVCGNSSETSPPAFDELFSKLFSSVLKGSNDNSTKDKSEDISSLSDSSSDSDNCDHSECEENDDENDEEDDDDEDEDSKYKLELFNKLLESHLNITRCMKVLLNY